MSSTSVNVFATTNIDQRRGAALEFADADLLKLNSEPLEIAASTTEAPGIEVENTGILIKTAVSADFDSGDVLAGHRMEFFVVPKTEEFNKTLISNRTKDQAFGMILYSESQDAGRSLMIDVYRCKAIGLNHALNEKAWDETELSVMPFIDGNGDFGTIYDMSN